MRDLFVPVGKKAMFHCNAESLPNELAPTLPIWMKNGVDLVIDGGCLIFFHFLKKFHWLNELTEFHNVVVQQIFESIHVNVIHMNIIIPPTEVFWGYVYWNHYVCPCVPPYVCLFIDMTFYLGH